MAHNLHATLIRCLVYLPVGHLLPALLYYEMRERERERWEPSAVLFKLPLTRTNLNMIFIVTYYLELRNAIFDYSTSHFLPAKVKLVV